MISGVFITCALTGGGGKPSTTNVSVSRSRLVILPLRQLELERRWCTSRERSRDWAGFAGLGAVSQGV